VNLISGLIAYSFLDKKPSLGINRSDMAFFATRPPAKSIIL
jgi:hypothetical protein